MNFKENRPIAWVVLVIAILFSVSFSGGGALKNARNEAMTIYTASAIGDATQSLSAYLDGVAQKSSEALSIARQYLPQDDKAIEKADEAVKMLSNEKDPAQRAEAYAKLTPEVESVYSALQNAGVSSTQWTDFERAYKDFKGYSDKYDRNKNEYNEPARKFNTELSKFPASLVGRIANVSQLSECP